MSDMDAVIREYEAERHRAETAARRAAQTAIHGSEFERSGRLDERVLRLRTLASRLALESRAAYSAWANWKAINDLLLDPLLSESLEDRGFTALGPVRGALVRDAFVSAFRLSAPYGDNKNIISLCRLVHMIETDRSSLKLDEVDWALDQGHRLSVASGAARRNSARLDRLLSMVVPVWPTEKNPRTPPRDTTFLSLKVNLRPVRDKLLAHLVDVDTLAHPTIDQIDQFVCLTLELAADAAFALDGSALGADEAREHLDSEARKFWVAAFKGLRN